MFVAVILIMPGLYAVDRARELAALDLQKALMAATETLTEKGPDFEEAIALNREMIESYVRHIENREAGYIDLLAKLLFSGYNPENVLREAVDVLKTAEKEKGKAAKYIAMWKAGGLINNFCSSRERFYKKRIIWLDSGKLPDDLSEDIEKSFDNSLELSKELEGDPNWLNALRACESNRKTMYLLFLGWLGYGSEDHIKEFRDCVKRTYSSKLELARNLPRDTEEQRIKQWLVGKFAESEKRREGILDAMLKGDTYMACVQMTEAIKIAYREKEELDKVIFKANESEVSK
jgi:hypothetical protein